MIGLMKTYLKPLSYKPWSGKINKAALDEAIDLMKISRKVTIDRDTEGKLPFGKVGVYGPGSDGSHCILVTPTATRNLANVAILHELVHAAQTEYYGIIKVEKLYSDCSELTSRITRSDWENPLEVEARRWSEALASTIKIAG